MRRKHNQKKHRILTLAKQKIPNLVSSQSLLLQDIHPDIDPEVEETLQAKDYSLFAPEDQQSYNQDKRQNFKQCKIRQLLCAKNYSPTHSDIDYMDTMQNYKSYLNKTHTLQIDNKSTHSVRPKQNPRSKTIEHNNVNRDIQTAIGQSHNKQLSIIKQKIDRIKTLQSRYKSPDQSFLKIYDKIERIKQEERGIKLSDSFCLLSVNEYVQMSKRLEGIVGNSKNCSMSKIVCYKAAKKPLSQQAKKWYCPKAYRTERNIDPQGLIKTINLEKWNQKKHSRSKLIIPPSASNLKSTAQNPQEQISQQRLISKTIQHNRPFTAPHRNKAQKLRTETMHINTRNTCSIEQRQKAVKIGMSLMMPLRKKVKGVRHVEREKFDWKQYKSESQRCKQIEKSMRSKTEMIFEYPWNWIKFQDSNQIHAKPWKS